MSLIFIASAISILCVGKIVTAPVTHQDQDEGWEKNCVTQRPSNNLVLEQLPGTITGTTTPVGKLGFSLKIASEFGIHMSQVKTWKKTAIGNLPNLFGKKVAKQVQNIEKNIPGSN